ncbi:TPA: hypothetical protein ACGIK9_003422 [Acinetobacter baumannii]|uniref:hypothetical protein n=1 Tax=Acinetobacter baumannii TaxID=470 RepID=UPI00338FB2C2
MSNKTNATSTFKWRLSNFLWRLAESNILVFIFFTIGFIGFSWATYYDNSVPDMIATEAQHRLWQAKHGIDDGKYLKGVYVGLVFSALSFGSYLLRNWARKN